MTLEALREEYFEKNNASIWGHKQNIKKKYYI
jgi:hypothetical protein